jgi:hypothetical protein
VPAVAWLVLTIPVRDATTDALAKADVTDELHAAAVEDLDKIWSFNPACCPDRRGPVCGALFGSV